MSENLLAIPGSSAPIAGTLTDYPNPSKEIEIRINLRSKFLTEAASAALNELLSQPPHLRRYLTHEELTDAMGASPDDVAAVEAYFAPFGIRVKAKNLLLCSATLTGRISDFEQAFSTQIAGFQGVGNGSFLANTSDFQLPEKLSELVQYAHPVQPTPRKESRLTLKMPPLPSLNQHLAAPAPVPPGYSPQTLAQAYQFPEDATGVGQTIGIIELGGKFSANDIKQFFAQVGIKKPKIVEVGTAAATTTGQMEAAMDVEIAGSLAPDATIVVYYGNTIAEVLQAVVADDVNKPTVVSMSWSGSEFNYSAVEVAILNQLIFKANILGITLVGSSADSGAYNGLTVPNVSLPSSSPLVLSCGGTTATITDDVLTEEVVWNELYKTNPNPLITGGGYSNIYTLPYYQAGAIMHYPYQKSTMRGIPDIAANASLDPGYQIVFAGQQFINGGTSAATPLVAALLARISEKLGYRLGFVNTVLYGFAGSDGFRPITQGNNGLYQAAPYWNPCTGLGSPVGGRLLALFQQLEHSLPAPSSEAPHKAKKASASH